MTVGYKLVYLEAGSGAAYPVDDRLVMAARKAIQRQVPLIVGGGIRTPQTAVQKVRAGADIIVTGTVLENSKDDLLVISGSYGEGGGQILRTALSFSVLLGRPVRITDIRARRPRPGLQPQHLTAVQALQKITGARVSGATLDSMELTFEPGPIRPGRYVFNIGTAGSVVLVAQTVLLPLLFADGPSMVRIIGGTDVEHAPSVDYFANVFLPWLERLGAKVEFHLARRGYFPKGMWLKDRLKQLASV